MKPSSRPRLVGLLAVLIVLGVADLLTLNLYALPAHLASLDASEVAAAAPKVATGTEPTTASDAARSAQEQAVEPQPPAEVAAAPADETPEAETAQAEPTAEPAVAAADEAPAEDAPADTEPSEGSADAKVAATKYRAPLEGVEDHIFPNIYFRSGSAVLRGPAREVLLAAVEALKEHPERRMVIEGHADLRGTRWLNVGLSADRARAVAYFLEARGIAKERFDIVALGARAPADVGTSETAFARNRRVALIWR